MISLLCELLWTVLESHPTEGEYDLGTSSQRVPVSEAPWHLYSSVVVGGAGQTPTLHLTCCLVPFKFTFLVRSESKQRQSFFLMFSFMSKSENSTTVCVEGGGVAEYG